MTNKATNERNAPIHDAGSLYCFCDACELSREYNDMLASQAASDYEPNRAVEFGIGLAIGLIILLAIFH